MEEIVLYIAKDSVGAALKMHDEIISQAKKLETFPKLGREVPDRKVRESGFRGNVVYIYRVLHGVRNYSMLYNDFS